MTVRLADISAHIHGVDQLRSVIGAMRAIAAARAQQSRGLLPGIRAYAGVIAQAIAQVLRLLPEEHVGINDVRSISAGLVLFTAEQGFAGAFSDRMIEAANPLLRHAETFLVGTRGAMLADERQMLIAWRTEMTLHSDGASAVAARICEALYERLPGSHLTHVNLIFPTWVAGSGLSPRTRSLLPLDRQVFADMPLADAPLTTLPPVVLLEYVYAQLCEAATESFAAENEMRVASMAAAKNNIEQMLLELQAQERQVRQEDITAEVIELAGASQHPPP